MVLALATSSWFRPFSPENREKGPYFWETEERWVDSVFSTLDTNGKIGQLFMVAAWSNKDMKHVREIRELIQNQKIGGLIFMQGGPGRQANLTNYFQSLSQVPLLIAIDGEWGLAMRLDSTHQYPKQMTLGAIQDDSLIYYMGKQIAAECRRVGIHVNFAPVADVNNNPDNPVISIRSFGEDKYAVARKAQMYMDGLQDMHVLACGKHFPGHGDTDKDSHKTLPGIYHDKTRLDTLELFPFRYLFQRGLGSVMVAHMYVPAIDTTSNLPTTLSPKVVTDLLKNQMQFKGLVFTDALNMKGAANYKKPGLLDVKALLAGNDVLLFSEDVPKAIEQIKLALLSNEISMNEIDTRVKKILKAKKWCGLDKKPRVPTRNLNEQINSQTGRLINSMLAEASMTLLSNKNGIIPFKRPDTLRIAELCIGQCDKNVFTATLEKYFLFDHFGVRHTDKDYNADSLIAKLKTYNLVVVQVKSTRYKIEDNFGMSTESVLLLERVMRETNCVVSFFSNPYVLHRLKDVDKPQAILMAYEYNNYSQKAAAEALVGAIPVTGKLPVTTGVFARGSGVQIKAPVRIQYVDPNFIGFEKKNSN